MVVRRAPNTPIDDDKPTSTLDSANENVLCVLTKHTPGRSHLRCPPSNPLSFSTSKRSFLLTSLALLFVVFCFGALTDPNLPPAPLNKEATTYYELTRAALNLEPVLDRAPSVATVQTLSLMGIYQVRFFCHLHVLLCKLIWGYSGTGRWREQH